jgi:hypothetical protein
MNEHPILHERQKWSTENLPPNYPSKCDRQLLREVIQDLYWELDKKTREGKNNEFWRFIILNAIQSGTIELQHRTNSLIALTTLGGVIISLIALLGSY